MSPSPLSPGPLSPCPPIEIPKGYATLCPLGVQVTQNPGAQVTNDPRPSPEFDGMNQRKLDHSWVRRI